MNAPAPGAPIAHCTHPRATHVHGTVTAYKYCKCRCDTCKKAVAKDFALRELDTARNGPRLVEATTVREHIHHLTTHHGMTLTHIAAAANTTPAHLRIVFTREGHKVTRTMRDRILAVTPTTTTPLADTSHVPATPTRRRVQALIAIGWTAANIAGHTTLTGKHVADLANGHQWTTHATASQIAHAYSQLAWATPPDSPWSTAARNRAARRGWAPPAAWDDIDNDTAPQPWQAATPTGRGWRGRTWHIDDVQHFADLGMDRAETARRLGIQPETLRDKLPALGHPELLEQLDRNATSRAA